MAHSIRGQDIEVKKALSAELSESNSATYAGPISLLSGGAVKISGTWVGTLALQIFSSTDDAYVTMHTWTTNPTNAQAIDPISHGVWRIAFTAFTSGTATVYMWGKKYL